MNKKYLVRLSDAERQICGNVVRTLKGGSQKSRRAQILLKADGDGPAWTDERISEAIGCRVQTVECVRQRFVTEGFELALEGQQRQTPPTLPILDGEAETPPLGSGRPGLAFTGLDDRLDLAFAHKSLPNPHDLPLGQPTSSAMFASIRRPSG